HWPSLGPEHGCRLHHAAVGGRLGPIVRRSWSCGRRSDRPDTAQRVRIRALPVHEEFFMRSRPRRVLVVNHWHDDNRGDSAITQGILRLLFLTDPLAEVTLAGLTELGPLADRSTVLVRRAFPQICTVPSLVPTELRGG